MKLSLISCVMFLCFAFTLEAVSADWPAFRGPQGNGITEDSGFATSWDSDKNITWRTPLPGPGNGSPIVIGDEVFLLCAEDQGQKRSTICLNRVDGSQKWIQTVNYDKIEETHKTNPFCPSTPASDGEHLYVWHRSAGMHCYKLDGTPVWSRDLGEFHHIWGGGPSPILYKDLVIQLCGPGERTFLIAFDKKTGETRWQSEIEPGGSASDKGRYVGTWATPSIVNVDGKDQILCPYHTRVVSYDPQSGKEINFIEGLHAEKSDLCYTSLMISGETAVILGGFRGPGFAFKLGGKGNTTESHRIWHTGDLQNPQRIGTGVIVGDFVYMANADNSGSLECFSLKTGEQTWKLPRSENGPHWASMIFAEGKLYATGQKGTTTVFEPNPEKLEVISINKLGEDCNATPAFSNGEIFIRTGAAIYCISDKKSAKD